MSTRSTTAAAAAGGARSRGRGHKERSKNFTELEKRTVLELIARHRDILKQGRSNNATNKNKQLVWSTICEEVNARCGGDRPRTPAQVKMWYENYKKKCKMRAADPQPQEGTSLLDGMLWQNMHPLDVKDEDNDAMENESAHSTKEDDCLPVNMSNGGRLSSCNESNDAIPNVLEPHVQIIPQSSPTPPPNPIKTTIPNPIQALANHIIMANTAADYRQKTYQEPLNLSHLDSDTDVRQNTEEVRNVQSKKEPNHLGNRGECSATEEERLYYTAKRQHAIWEHEAKMRILNMELRQKEEIFSLQKQLFLIELKLKMDYLEKACAK